MPRRIRRPNGTSPLRHSGLVDALVAELKSSLDFGQPLIEEEEFKTGAIKVSVTWDRWDPLSEEERSSVIIEAYRIALGEEYADRIALVYGLTIPEAHASGMLPVQIIAALREDDPVTPDACRQSMIEEGASTLRNPEYPELRFSNEEEAEACLKRLSARLPGSEPCWVIIKEPTSWPALDEWDFSK